MDLPIHYNSKLKGLDTKSQLNATHSPASWGNTQRFLTGSACSGTKSSRVASVQDTLDVAGHQRSSLSGRPLSLISIDMGIRNLAYAHFTATTGTSQKERATSPHYDTLRLSAWKRLDISSTIPVDYQTSIGALEPASLPFTKDKDSIARTSPPAKSGGTVKHTFEPSIYASQAFTLISDVLRLHKPTHILIERQRFRSGGGSAVQEWTIRIGVLEGMLYAVLKTLKEVTGNQMAVSGIQPTRVNRYWLEEGSHRNDKLLEETTKIAAKEAKKIKIDVVGQMLKSSRSIVDPFRIEGQALATVDRYLSSWQKTKKASSAKAADPPLKLDDLADCLLQGLAWIRWQNNIQQLQQLGNKAFDFTAD